MKQLLRAAIWKAVPQRLQSYIFTPRRPDTSQWDDQFASGKWGWLSSTGEMPRYAVISGYCKTLVGVKNILDVGCADGLLLDWLIHEKHLDYCGIDISAVAIDQARTRAGRDAKFEVGDATSFDPGQKFDIVVFNEMLYYIPDPESVIRRFGRFITANGVLIISMWRYHASIRAWRRCSPLLQVLYETTLSNNSGCEWDIRVCKLIDS